MNANELRIGNLVTQIIELSTHNKEEIITIEWQDLMWISRDSLNCYKPILITEEVLLRCGGVKSESVVVNDCEYIEVFWINEFFSVVLIYSNYGGIDEFEIIYNSHGEKVYGIKNTRYLHTLQNFLALTGEELQYNHSPSI